MQIYGKKIVILTLFIPLFSLCQEKVKGKNKIDQSNVSLDYTSTLPTELKLSILEYLDINSLLQMAYTNKIWSHLALEELHKRVGLTALLTQLNRERWQNLFNRPIIQTIPPTPPNRMEGESLSRKTIPPKWKKYTKEDFWLAEETIAKKKKNSTFKETLHAFFQTVKKRPEKKVVVTAGPSQSSAADSDEIFLKQRKKAFVEDYKFFSPYVSPEDFWDAISQIYLSSRKNPSRILFAKGSKRSANGEYQGEYQLNGPELMKLQALPPAALDALIVQQAPKISPQSLIIHSSHLKYLPHNWEALQFDLKSLIIRDSPEITNIPELQKLTALENLYILRCPKLTQLEIFLKPELLATMQNLKKISIVDCPIIMASLPDNIENFSRHNFQEQNWVDYIRVPKN